MNQHTQSPAARYLSELQARGVKVELIRNNSPYADSVVSPYEIQMTGGRKLPGDWDRVKRHKRGLVELLAAQKAYGMALSDWEIASDPVSYALNDKRGLGPSYNDKEGDEKVCATLTAPEPVFKPLNKSKTRKKAKFGSAPVLSPEIKALGSRYKSKTERKKREGRAPIDESGKTYGNLTVLSLCKERTESGAIRWLCRCKCGTVKPILGISLRNGDTRACGDCPFGRKNKSRWANVDWSRPINDIADELGCKPETDRKNRREIENHEPK